MSGFRVQPKSMLVAVIGAAIVVFPSCSGDSRRPIIPSTSRGIPSESGYAKVMLSITIPKRTSNKLTSKGRPTFVSPSTASVSIDVNDGAAHGVENLGTALPGCDGSTPAEVTCTIPIDSPLGSDKFTVIAYDGPGASGNELSKGETTTDVDGSPQVIPITLNGIVKTIHVFFANPPGPHSCGDGPFQVPVDVAGLDADNNVITAPGQYENPISINDVDSIGTTSLTTAVVSAPDQEVYMSYDGGPTNAVISASADGAAPNSAAFDPQNYEPLGGPFTEYFSTTPGMQENDMEVTVESATPPPQTVTRSTFTFPTQGLCRARAVFDENWEDDDYYGVTSQNGSSSLQFYVEDQVYRPANFIWWQWYYPGGYVYDVLPETAGSSWNANSYRDDYSQALPQDAAQYGPDWAESWYLPGTDSYCYQHPPEEIYGQTIICNTNVVTSDQFQNMGPAALNSDCAGAVGPGLPTTANHILETWSWSDNDIYGDAESWSGTSDYYVADGIGLLCYEENADGAPAYNELSGFEALQSIGAGSQGMGRKSGRSASFARPAANFMPSLSGAIALAHNLHRRSLSCARSVRLHLAKRFQDPVCAILRKRARPSHRIAR